MWRKRTGLCLDTSLLPSLLGVGILIHCLPAPALGKATPRSTGGSFEGANPHLGDSSWLRGRQKPSVLVRRAWSSLDGEESKSTPMCEACVSTYSGQTLGPEGKCPSSRTDSLLYFESDLPFSHPNSSKQNTEKQKTESIDTVLVAHGSFS